MRLLLDTQIMPGFCWQHLGGGHQAPTRQIDRLLIGQARVEGLMAVSADARWPGYDVLLHRV
jgi:PIN domain nuclease of toxin-antitoxin system